MRHGTAGTWAENFLVKTIGAETPKDLGTWASFLDKFRLQFKEYNKKDKVQSALIAFSQGRMIINRYSNQFIFIAADANISNKKQVSYYQRELDPKVMDKIYNKETLPKDMIQDWINTAYKVNGYMRT